LFCNGKLVVRHRNLTPCYPKGMEMFLFATILLLLITLVVDTGKKRRTFLCQQAVIKKPH